MTPRELRRWRDEQYLSQSELASMLQVTTQTVKNWEMGRSPIPHMATLAFETIAGTRAQLVRNMRKQREKLAHERRLKAIAQGVTA